MFRYIFAVIAAFSIYALAIYAALSNQTPINCRTTANYITFGIAK